MAEKLSQSQRLLKVLKSGKSITQDQAKRTLKIASPSKRISELREEGVKITSTRTRVKDRATGTMKSVVKYALGK